MRECTVEAAPAFSERVYTPLSSLQDLGQGLEETLLPLAWRIVNDSFRTDVCLLFPPFQIALACLHMASVILGRFYSRFYVRGVLGNKCAGHHNLKTVKMREIMFK
jgi:hypothetical protein